MSALDDMFGLAGKVALVTGAGAGLGRSFTEALIGAGAKVFAADIAGDRAEETAARFADACTPLTMDVADPAAVEAGVAEILEVAGRIDILVNNAGIAMRGRRTHEIAPEDWTRMIGIHLTGSFLCARAVIPAMLEADGGSIINISSILGVAGHYPGFPMATASYGAAKAGIIGLTRQIAVEYAADRIRANAIAPGWHGGTRLSENFRRDMSNADIARFEDTIMAGTPMGRRGTPDELQGLVVYLASDASSYLTGQVIVQDGGWTAR